VVLAPNRYVAGQETALVARVNGGDARPTFTPPRVFDKGVGGRATLVSNVETLAHLALVLRHGPDWFRGVGLPADPGSALATVTGGVPHPGVVELALGTTLRQMTTDLGGLERTPTAVLLGGYYGTWQPAGGLWDVPLGHQSLREANATFGAGVVVILDDRHCGLAESARVLTYLAGESAAQCGPCQYGLPSIAAAFQRLVAGGSSTAAAQVSRWAGMVAGRGACGLPDGAAAFALSALSTFAEEVERHRRSGPCPASRAALLPVTAAPRGPQDWR
jgi:NADH:ubiquinone oxidoreductase subunit F (NADH-binding)